MFRSLHRSASAFVHSVRSTVRGPKWARDLPRTSVPWGELPRLATGRLTEATMDWYRELGDVGLLRVGGAPAVLVSEAALAHRVLTNSRDFGKGIDPGFASIFGRGIAGIPADETWRRHRKLMHAPFGRRAVDAVTPAILESIERSLDRLVVASGASRQIEVDFNELSQDLTLDVLCDVMLGFDAPADVRQGMRVLGRDFVKYNTVIQTLGEHAPNPYRKRMMDARAALDRAGREVLGDRSRARDVPLMEMFHDHADAFEGDEALDNLATLFFAGHDTTAHALGWTFYFLGRPENREIAGTLRAAVDATSLDALARREVDLPMLEWCGKEAMRLIPPLPLTIRHPIRPGVELAGVELPHEPPTMIFVNLQAIQNRADRWPSPNRFDPERWSPERADTVPPKSWFPFGAGPRVCLGMYMSQVEQKLVLAAMLRRFEIDIPNLGEITPHTPLVTMPRPAMRMTLRPRG